MKKINLFLLCFAVILASLCSCSSQKDITENIIPYFKEGSVFNGGFEFDDLSVKAKVNISNETTFSFTSEGTLFGTELKYTEDAVIISYEKIQFTQSLDKNDPFYIFTEIFRFLSTCTFHEKNAVVEELNGAPIYIFDLSYGERDIRFTVDKASYTPYSVETSVNGKRSAVYFHG